MKRLLIAFVFALVACGEPPAHERPPDSDVGGQEEPDQPADEPTGLRVVGGTSFWLFIDDSRELVTSVVWTSGRETRDHDVSLRSSDETVVRTEGQTVVAVGRGRATVTIVWDAWEAEVTIDVYSSNAARLVISPETIEVERLSVARVSARVFTENDVEIRGGLEWSSADPSIASVRVESDFVVVEGRAVGGTEIVARYADVVATAPVTVQPATPARIVITGDTDVEPGTSTALEVKSATQTGDVIGDVERGADWSIEDESIATVDSNGVVTGVAEGETTVTVRVDAKVATATIAVHMPGALNNVAHPGPCRRLGYTDSGLHLATYDFAYDPSANLVGIDYDSDSYFGGDPITRREVLDYDAQNRLVRHSIDHDVDGVVEELYEYFYTSSGLLERRRNTEPSGHYVEEAFTYDDQDRVLEVVWTRTAYGVIGRDVWSYAPDGLTGTLDRFDGQGGRESSWTYAWDASGKLIERRRVELTYVGEERYWTYWYDAADHLVGWERWRPFSLDPTQRIIDERWNHAYDRGGNRLQDEREVGMTVIALWSYDYSCWVAP